MKNRKKKKKNEIDRRVSEHKASFLITTGVCVCVCVYHYADERALIGGAHRTRTGLKKITLDI